MIWASTAIFRENLIKGECLEKKVVWDVFLGRVGACGWGKEEEEEQWRTKKKKKKRNR